MEEKYIDPIHDPKWQEREHACLNAQTVYFKVQDALDSNIAFFHHFARGTQRPMPPLENAVMEGMNFLVNHAYIGDRKSFDYVTRVSKILKERSYSPKEIAVAAAFSGNAPPLPRVNSEKSEKLGNLMALAMTERQKAGSPDGFMGRMTEILDNLHDLGNLSTPNGRVDFLMESPTDIMKKPLLMAKGMKVVRDKGSLYHKAIAIGIEELMKFDPADMIVRREVENDRMRPAGRSSVVDEEHAYTILLNIMAEKGYRVRTVPVEGIDPAGPEVVAFEVDGRGELLIDKMIIMPEFKALSYATDIVPSKPEMDNCRHWSLATKNRVYAYYLHREVLQQRYFLELSKEKGSKSYEEYCQKGYERALCNQAKFLQWKLIKPMTEADMRQMVVTIIDRVERDEY